MRVLPLGLILAAALAGCGEKTAPTGDPRVELRQLGPESIQLLPAAGQFPFCLVFTASETGVVRRLTMPPDRMSVPCEAGQPIGGLTYKIPAREGKVKVYVLFSDQQVKADPIGTQVFELVSAKRPVSLIDMRVPGRAQLGTLEFTPSASVAGEAVQGGAVTRDGGEPDGASDTASAPDAPEAKDTP